MWHVFIYIDVTCYQWRNSRESRVPPDISHWEISGDLPGKETQGKKRENGEEKKENRKKEGVKLKIEGGKVTK